MTVESKIDPQSAPNSRWHYPALGYSDPLNGTFIIVLFSQHGHGTVVYAANERGTQVGGWMSAWDMKCFKPWRGTVILKDHADPD